jgi:hypothetical protein
MNVTSGLKQTENVGARVVGSPPVGFNADDVVSKVAETVQSLAPQDRLRAIRFSSDSPVETDGTREIVVDATVGSDASSANLPAPRAKVISAVVRLTGGVLAVLLPFYERRAAVHEAQTH